MTAGEFALKCEAAGDVQHVARVRRGVGAECVHAVVEAQPPHGGQVRRARKDGASQAGLGQKRSPL